MSFSSANVPIARDTWAPKSPPARPAPPPKAVIYGVPPSALPALGTTSSMIDGLYRPSATPAAPLPPFEAYRPPQAQASNGAQPSNGKSEAVPDPRAVSPAGQGSSSETRPATSSQPRASSSATARAPGSDSGAKPLIKAEANPVLGVFGLSIRTKERDLEDEFGRFGAVEKVVIVYDQRTDRSRGFGFITMRKTEEAKRAIEKLNGITLHGRTIRVDFSATQKPHNPTPGEYMGAKRPIVEDPRHDSRPPGPRDIIVDRYDDRRMDDRRRMDDWDRYSRDDRPYRDDRDMRPRDDYLPRRSEDPYGGRSRRDDYERDRRRSPSPPPRRRRSPSPYRRSRDYDGYRRSRSPLPIPQDHLRY